MNRKGAEVERQCARQRRWMLLATAGELPRYGRRRLQRHLIRCDACRAAREHLAAVSRGWAQSPDWSLPPPGRMERILAAGAQQQQARKTQVQAWPVGAPVWRLAAAAALLIAWLGWETWRVSDRHPRPPRPAFPAAAILAAEQGSEDDLEHALAAWEALLTLLPDDDSDPGRHGEREWQYLAYELLSWEES